MENLLVPPQVGMISVGCIPSWQAAIAPHQVVRLGTPVQLLRVGQGTH